MQDPADRKRRRVEKQQAAQMVRQDTSRKTLSVHSSDDAHKQSMKRKRNQDDDGDDQGFDNVNHARR